MSDENPKSLREIAEESKYPIDAFFFVRKGLDFTVERVHQSSDEDSQQQRHVDGRELSAGLRDYAMLRYGPMARVVLNRWHVQRTEDFGAIVFAMVNGGLMQATEHDRVEHFTNVFDFETAFEAGVDISNTPIHYSLNLGEQGEKSK